MFNFTNDQPLFQQIADQIETLIINEVFEEETQVPSTTEISTLYKINPATVLKGMNILVDKELIYKQRGVGMFVVKGAVEKIKKERKANFYETYIVKMVSELTALEIDRQELQAMIERAYRNEKEYPH